MMTTTDKRISSANVAVCSLDELERDRFRVISADGRTILVVIDDGKVFALDNRCPHMGFPLHRGTVGNGILTCHWHHAKFDLASGCTLDPFADDAPSFTVEIRDGIVYVDPRPIESARRAHWMQKLDEGLEQSLNLVLAKSVIGLDEFGATGEILKKASLFGATNRAAGWSVGLSILTAMANILSEIDDADRRLALYHGVIHVASSTAGQPPNFDLSPLATTDTSPQRYIEWFRTFVDSRSEDAAKRTLRTAIHAGLPKETIATMIFAACTDHLYMDEGHSLDYANKAFELLEHIGWDCAESILPSLVANFVSASRAEERESWRHPLDLPACLTDAFANLDELIAVGSGRLKDWRGHKALAEIILDSEPDAIVEALCGLIRDGVPLVDLSSAVAYAAARRLVHFHISNEFGDWNTVHHTFTYANAVDQALRRAPSSLLARGIFDGALSVYLNRFLNIPKQGTPLAVTQQVAASDLLACFDMQGQVDESAQIAAALLASKSYEDVIRTLGHALLREDSGFHAFQSYEAGVRQYKQFNGSPLGDDILIAVTRFLTAHSPSVRATGQTFKTAQRLHRGEALHEDA